VQFRSKAQSAGIALKWKNNKKGIYINGIMWYYYGMGKYDLSIVVPLYNEAGTIVELYEKVKAQFLQCDVKGEIIFIDDGSTDKSKEIINNLCDSDTDCRLISFRTNCGKAAALSVGFDKAQGEYIITMDADLQDDPEEIPQFLEALKDYDIVSGWKKDRKDPLEKRLPSKLYNKTVRAMTKTSLHDMNCGFKGYRRKAVKEIKLYGELHRYIPAILAARGFTITEIVVKHHKRKSGKSKYGFERYIRGLFDLITVVYLTKYMRRPLHLFGGIALGAFIFGVLGLIAGFCVLSYFWYLDFLAGVLIILSIISLTAVLPLLGIGLIAEKLNYDSFSSYIPPVEETRNCE